MNRTASDWRNDLLLALFLLSAPVLLVCVGILQEVSR